jgi:RNA polymerase sigma-70 factor (ECF subfamily)
MPKKAADWLPAARAGSAEALGAILEACRGYLLLIAQRELNPDLQPKGGASDLVQQTLLDACQGFALFQGHSEAELLAWLRRLLLNNLASFARQYRGTNKRQVRREVTLPSGGSSANRQASLATRTPSPSGHAMAREWAQAVQRALEQLPDEYRQVIQLRYEEGRSFEDIGQLLGCTPNAARKLWVRAIKRLQNAAEGAP